MCSVPAEELAAERARWLSELAVALDEARQLVTGLEIYGGQRLLARELYLRIEAARFEVQSLRLSRSLNPRVENGPEWIGSAAWQTPLPEID